MTGNGAGKRIAVGCFMQETNTFSPTPTTVADFEAHYLRRGADVLTGYGTARVEVPGFLSVLTAAGATPVPLLATHAASSGALTRDCFEAILGELLQRLEDAGPLDGILLALHGSMAVADNGDAEGEILERVRAAHPNLPIGVSLDLHGHITQRMLQPDTFLIGYREYPHIDMFETGARVAELMMEVLAGRRRPVMAFAKRPLLFSPVRCRTDDGPLTSIVAEARHMEEREAHVLHASLFPVQPWLDVPDIGFAALVCADGDIAAAKGAADHLADLAWAARGDFEPDLTPIDEVIRIGLSSPGLTVVGDGGDAPTSGAPADDPTILKRLLALGADKAARMTYVTLRDAPAVQKAFAAGPGATVTLSVGHSLSAGEPVEITGIVRSLSDGTYVMRDAGAAGLETHQGPTVVLHIGAIRLVLRSLGGFEWDTGVYTAFGLDLRYPALAFAKSPSHFRVSYTPFAARILAGDTPGASACNLRRLKLVNVTRPLYPLDDI
ncbi:MAG: M81 family metallopeptidase [Chelatococcus sp.]|uniref:M81 family metallopeptidase n=1 Tax=Chelatococcus sp. TaxID=1953771 RepID=UPI0025C1EBBE|nr:M81 family metallopeptidase [Chelatococcus sp.]MBX3538051.1 M81 family metallopeptidase [Chelatococcus sp.]